MRCDGEVPPLVFGVHQLVAERAATAPNAVAVVTGDATLTYQALNLRANQVAHRLLQLGVGVETRVAVVMDRCAELFVSLLGVLKAGGAYVPIDPGDPPERVAFLLAQSGAAVVIAPSSVRLPATGQRLVLDADTVLDTPTSAPDVVVEPDNLAYVVYTSGSTGEPKGVMIHHRAIANLADWQRRYFGHDAGDRVTALANVAFDALACELWTHLAAGASLYVVDNRTRADPAALADFLLRNRITRCCLPTGLVQAMVEQDWPADSRLRVVFCGGDRLHWPTRTPPWQLYNHYGPTETTVFMTAARVDRADGGDHPPIGRPIDNVTAHVLGPAMAPVPAGVAGELFIGGLGVGRGYLGRPGLTAERFVPDPFGPPGAVFYRTGDIVRKRLDGDLEFVGRADDQVKIRGFRVELSEIEAGLRSDAQVRDAAVISHGSYMVAYLTAAGIIDTTGVLDRLRERLPEYMIPAHAVALPELPLTRNGKLDRNALRALPSEAAHELPQGGVEKRLAELVGALLDVAAVGRRDSFFYLGGHSLLATRLIVRIRAVFDVDIPLADFYAAPTVAGLAEAVAKAGRPSRPHAPVSRAARAAYALSLADLDRPVVQRGSHVASRNED